VINLTDKQLDAYHAAASRANRAVSDWARLLLDAQVQRSEGP
jgi:hypothetical protein